MVTREEIEAARTPKGGWTRAQLEVWGVPWPPPKGWLRALVSGKGHIPRSTKPSLASGARKRGAGLSFTPRGAGPSGREARVIIAEIEAANEELIGDASREVPCDHGALVQQLYFCRTCRKVHERWETLRYLTQVSAEEPTKCVECAGAPGARMEA